MTPRQEEILQFIRDFSRESGFPPSVRDIGEHFGLYPATVHDHIKALERKGHLERRPNQSRSLVAVEGRPRRPQPRKSRSNPHATPLEVPIVGRVAAGSPILAEENIEDVVRLPEGWAPAGAFLLRVQGDSMRDAHILDGDYVLVRPQPSAADGDIVVALIEDEATVKRFYRTRDGIELRAQNPAFGPIRVGSSEGVSVGVVGKVVGVLRV